MCICICITKYSYMYIYLFLKIEEKRFANEIFSKVQVNSPCTIPSNFLLASLLPDP